MSGLDGHAKRLDPLCTHARTARRDGLSRILTTTCTQPQMAQREGLAQDVMLLNDAFGLDVDTGIRAIHYLDRYFASRCPASPVRTFKVDFLHVAATTALLIAAKFADTKRPPLSQLVLWHEKMVDQAELRWMELDFLSALEWNLHAFAPSGFVSLLHGVCDAVDVPARVAQHIEKLITDATVKCSYTRYAPSTVAAAAMMGAWYIEDMFAVTMRYAKVLAQTLQLDEAVLWALTFMLVADFTPCSHKSPPSESGADTELLEWYQPPYTTCNDAHSTQVQQEHGDDTRSIEGDVRINDACDRAHAMLF